MGPPLWTEVFTLKMVNTAIHCPSLTNRDRALPGAGSPAADAAVLAGAARPAAITTGCARPLSGPSSMAASTTAAARRQLAARPLRTRINPWINLLARLLLMKKIATRNSEIDQNCIIWTLRPTRNFVREQLREQLDTAGAPPGMAGPWAQGSVSALFVEGYASQLSYKPGDLLSLHINTSAPEFHIDIARVGLN